jgi:hypothetical protein
VVDLGCDENTMDKGIDVNPMDDDDDVGCDEDTMVSADNEKAMEDDDSGDCWKGRRGRWLLTAEEE